MLSVGTAFDPKASLKNRPDLPMKAPRLGVPSHLSSLLKIAQDHVRASLDSEKTWSSFKEHVGPRKEDQRRFIRINPALLHEPPDLDKVAAMQQLREEVQNIVKNDPYIQQVALQLVATLFYFHVRDSDFTGSELVARGEKLNSTFALAGGTIVELITT